MLIYVNAAEKSLLVYQFTIIPEKSTTAKRISYIYLYCKGTNTTTTEPSMVHLIKSKNEIKEVVYIYVYQKSFQSAGKSAQ